MRCKAWGEKHELWKLDLRNLDLGLVGDKIARAVREAYTKLVSVMDLNNNMLMVSLDFFSLTLGQDA